MLRSMATSGSLTVDKQKILFEVNKDALDLINHWWFGNHLGRLGNPLGDAGEMDIYRFINAIFGCEYAEPSELTGQRMGE